MRKRRLDRCVDAKSCWLTTWRGKPRPFAAFHPPSTMVARWGLTLAPGLFTGSASITWSALAEAHVSHQNGFTIVLTWSAATGVELQQVIVQSSFQVLPFGFHVAKVGSAENFVDGLQLCGVEMNSMETISAGQQLRCCHAAVRALWRGRINSELRKNSFVFLDSSMYIMQMCYHDWWAPVRNYRSKTSLISEVCVGLAFLDMPGSFSVDSNDKLKHPIKPIFLLIS